MVLLRTVLTSAVYSFPGLRLFPRWRWKALMFRYITRSSFIYICWVQRGIALPRTGPRERPINYNSTPKRLYVGILNNLEISHESSARTIDPRRGTLPAEMLDAITGYPV